jgi:hypothetical protein
VKRSSIHVGVVLVLALSTSSGCRKAGGDLSSSQLTDVVAREQPSLEPCYQQGLERTPYEHEFRIETKLTIKPDGSVAKVEMDQNGLQGMGPCIEKTIRTWQFPQAKASTYASLPLIFRPKVVENIPDGVIPQGFKVLEAPTPNPP